MLAELLADYSDGIAKFTGTVTCLHFLSGAVLMNDIRLKGRSDSYPVDPFLGGMVQTILSVKLGFILDDVPMVNVNAIGCLVNLIYSIIFCYYATPSYKVKMVPKVGAAAIFLTVCLAYISYEDPAKIEFRLGMIITALLIGLVGIPLLNLGKIMRRRSTEGLPFPIILGGTIVSASWTLYAISINNTFLAYQNLFLFILSAIQLSLFAIYPTKSNHAVHRSRSNTFFILTKRDTSRHDKLE